MSLQAWADQCPRPSKRSVASTPSLTATGRPPGHRYDTSCHSVPANGGVAVRPAPEPQPAAATSAAAAIASVGLGRCMPVGRQPPAVRFRLLDDHDDVARPDRLAGGHLDLLDRARAV